MLDRRLVSATSIAQDEILQKQRRASAAACFLGPPSTGSSALPGRIDTRLSVHYNTPTRKMRQSRQATHTEDKTMTTAVERDYERTLIDIARVLPPNRVEQLVDFARFLETQSLSEVLVQEEELAEIETDNARWDELMATDEAQTLLNKLAEEALIEHRAGKTKPMAFNNRGQIVPG